jgi:uncharacterized protein YkwD
MHLRPLGFVLLALGAPLACRDGYYSQDPKVAAAVAGAAAGIAVAQAIAEHSTDNAGGGGILPEARDLPSLREYTLRAINRLRADHSLPLLTRSATLNEFAQRGSEWLEEDNQPRHHFSSDARCVRCEENQIRTDGESAAPAEVQIDTALNAMMLDGTQRRANLLSPVWRFVGVGIVGAGSTMYLTIDFAEGAL